MRGEYLFGTEDTQKFAELPPRARRIRSLRFGTPWAIGTTSACAENTVFEEETGRLPRNYLRVRGEYAISSGLVKPLMELPPRARRIRRGRTPNGARAGTTSACAENTPITHTAHGCVGNYLRVRGEYISSPPSVMLTTELPPRARRIPKHFLGTRNIPGTTSACAENT